MTKGTLQDKIRSKSKQLHKRKITIHKRPHFYFAIVCVGIFYTLTQIYLHGMLRLHEILFLWGNGIGLGLWTLYEVIRFFFALWIFLKIKRWGL